ncbi:MAG: hypothetical protein ACKOPN_02780 [Prochlorococcaceae cyanobacterium]|jgi:hypothetical protein
MSELLVRQTPCGCSILRDGPLGFVVQLGGGGDRRHRVPTLQAAYALCERLHPAGQPSMLAAAPR